MAETFPSQYIARSFGSITLDLSALTAMDFLSWSRRWTACGTLKVEAERWILGCVLEIVDGQADLCRYTYPIWAQLAFENLEYGRHTKVTLPTLIQAVRQLQRLDEATESAKAIRKLIGAMEVQSA